MVSKTRKINNKESAIDAEIIPQTTNIKEDSSSPEKEQPTINPLQVAINELTKQHTEKGTLAFEFLKSLIAGKAPLNYDMNVLENLNVTAFQLADLFKKEMDVRWSAAITDVVNKLQTSGEISKLSSTLQ